MEIKKINNMEELKNPEMKSCDYAELMKENLPEITKQADILVSAAGKAGIITADMVKPGATVIDVGTNQVNGKLCGDVAFEEVKKVSGAVTPVPGGVGPMTIASLMENTTDIARNRCGPFI